MIGLLILTSHLLNNELEKPVFQVVAVHAGRILLYLHTIRNSSALLYKSPDSGLYLIYSLWSTPVVLMGRAGHRFRWARAPSAALRTAPRARRGAEKREPSIHKVPGSTTAARGMGGAERLAQLYAREREGEGAERRAYSLL